MMKRLPVVLASVSLAFALAGCGATPAMVTAKASVGTLRAADAGAHQQMNAIVLGVLKSYMPFLLSSADANKDGVIAESELKARRSPAAVSLFFAQFDTNHDHGVSADEFSRALATEAPVEAYHHFTEGAMSAAIKPYMADKDFESGELRTYMTTSLGLTADFPLLFKLMAQLDLNEDDKLLSAKGEGPAFMLTFAAPQLQSELGMTPELNLKALQKSK